MLAERYGGLTVVKDLPEAQDRFVKLCANKLEAAVSVSFTGSALPRHHNPRVLS